MAPVPDDVRGVEEFAGVVDDQVPVVAGFDAGGVDILSHSSAEDAAKVLGVAVNVDLAIMQPMSGAKASPRTVVIMMCCMLWVHITGNVLTRCSK